MTDTLPIYTATRVVPVVEIGVGDERTPGVAGLWQQDTNLDNVPDVPGFAETRWQPTEPAVGDDAATSHWSADDVAFFVDVSCHVREVSTFAGRERADETWEVGTATITVDNRDGWADYPRTGDPDQLLTMRPGRQVRVGVKIDGGPPRYLWGGYIDGMEPGFDPDDGEFVTLECIDAKGEAGRTFLGALAAGVGAGDTASTRAARILNSAAWFTNRRDIQANSVQLRATSYDAQVVDLLNLAADSSGGACFGDVNGRVAFRSRDWQAVSVAAVPDGTISNNPADGGVCPAGWEQSFNREDISTNVLLSRPNEVPRVFRDAAGFNLFGDETFERTDLETNLTSDIDIIGTRIRDVRSYTHMPRIAAVTLDAGTEPAVADLLAKVSPFKPSVVKCVHRVQQADGTFRSPINGMYMVVGVEHSITPESWQARISLDNAKPFQIGAADGRWSDGTAATGYWTNEADALTGGAFRTTWSAGV